jgi:predicted RNA-binding protein with RPS1 domain
VGGIVSSTREFVDWVHHPLETGDEVRIKIVESNSTDPPRKRRREDPKEDLKRQKRYVRDAAKKLGWKITTGP